MMGGGRESNSSSLMMWSGTADSKNMMSSLMPCAAEEQGGVSTSKMPPLSSSSSSSMLLQIPSSTGGLLLGPEVNGGAGTAASLASNLRDDVGQESSMPESWSQLLLAGLAGDHERYSAATALLSKGLEEGPLPHAAPAAYNFCGGNHGADEIQASKSPAVSQMLLVSPPSSCITSSLRGSNMLEFSNGTAPAPDQLKNHQSDNSSESNSNATGSAPKKARVQTSSSAQSTLKVRKERLGDRVTALHQIVSPFGKTDTASVLQETIGYIRFLLSQIEALSYPYLLGGHVGAAGNVDTSVQQYQQPADAEEDNGGEASEKDLRSRGLCLVPVSCTSRLADDGGASDFWAPPPPAPLGGTGIIWR